MSEVVKSLLPTLARMTDAEKAELRELLIPPDEGEPNLTQQEWEDAWDEECQRRIAAVERGEMELIPAEEVFRQLRARHP